MTDMQSETCERQQRQERAWGEAGGTLTGVDSPIGKVSPWPCLWPCQPPKAGECRGVCVCVCVRVCECVSVCVCECVCVGGLIVAHVQCVSRLIGPPQCILYGPVPRMRSLGTGTLERWLHQQSERRLGLCCTLGAATESDC